MRTYWSPEACERVTGYKPEGVAANGFIHLINSGATALDGNGAATNEKGEHVMKPFWEMTEQDMRRLPGGHRLAPGQLRVLPGRRLLQPLPLHAPRCL